MRAFRLYGLGLFCLAWQSLMGAVLSCVTWYLFINERKIKKSEKRVIFLNQTNDLHLEKHLTKAGSVHKVIDVVKTNKGLDDKNIFTFAI